MKNPSLIVIVAVVLVFTYSSNGSVIQNIGNYGNWGSVNWQALGGLDDPVDFVASKGEIDFVGDATDSAGYWGMDSDYLYFRMRLAIPTNAVDTFHDTHYVMIDALGYDADDGRPDYAFGWDSKSNDPVTHGLEMLGIGTLGTTWDKTKMEDIDGSPGKGTNDINGLISGSTYRTTDGYVQSSDGHSTTSLGDTTFLDFAVSLSYLSNYVPALVDNPNWKIQFATIDNANDHAFLTGDLAGGISHEDNITTAGWSNTIAIPEPMVSSMIVLFGTGVFAVRRIFG